MYSQFLVGLNLKLQFISDLSDFLHFLNILQQYFLYFLIVKEIDGSVVEMIDKLNYCKFNLTY